MRKTPIILDRLDAALKKNDVTLKRAQLLETAAMAFGYHNAAEFSAADKAGGLDAAPAEVIGRVNLAGIELIAMKDGSGTLYAIDETFLEQVVEQERRELFGISPYGGLVYLGHVADHPATDCGAMPSADDKRMTSSKGRYALLDSGFDQTTRHDTEVEAQTAAMNGEDRTDVMIVDLINSEAQHYDWGWRSIPVEGRDEREIMLAASFAVAQARLVRSRESHEQTLRLDVPDWRTWEKDLKKASRKGQDPISDEILHQFRHAVADVTSKSSSSQKFEVTYRQQRYVEKHLGGLIARLDRAEDALRDANIAPKDISRRTADDAAEMLAAIEAVKTVRAGEKIPGLYEVDATRDGSRCREVFRVGEDEDPEERAREIAAKEFRMNLDDYRDDEYEDSSLFDSECDSFYVEPVMMPEAAAIISDALVLLSTGGDFRFGIPHDHPARIKLIAAREKMVIQPSV